MELTFPFCLGEGAQLFLGSSVNTHVVSFARNLFSRALLRRLWSTKGLFKWIFEYYSPYWECHGDEENQNNLNKKQILQGSNRRVAIDLYRLGNKRPDLENRRLLMDSVLRLENLCQYLGVCSAVLALHCTVSSVDRAILQAVGMWDKLELYRPEKKVCCTEQRNLSLWLTLFHVKSRTYKSRLFRGMIMNNSSTVAQSIPRLDYLSSIQSGLVYANKYSFNAAVTAVQTTGLH